MISGSPEKRSSVKLLDFGVAKLMHPDAAGDALPLAPSTVRGHVVGTPDYMSPEQARARKVDGKTDVYALGVIAYEMLFGRRPFEADNAADVVRMHLSDKPPSPRSLWPEIPAPLDELLRAMLDKSADQRPSPAAVRTVIRELRGTPPPFDWDAAPPSLPRVQPPTTPTENVVPLPSAAALARRRLALLAAGLALFAVGSGMLATFFVRSGRVSQVATEASPPATAVSPPQTAPTPRATPLASPTTPAPEGAVVVHVDASDARIELDGQRVAPEASGAPIRVAPGDHELLVGAPGRQRYRGQVHVVAGETADVVVHLRHGGGATRPSVVRAARPSVQRPATQRTPSAHPRRNDPDYLVDPFGARR